MDWFGGVGFTVKAGELRVAQPFRNGFVAASVVRGLVAAPQNAGACLVAESGGGSDPGIGLPLPQAWVVGQPPGGLGTEKLCYEELSGHLL